MGLLSGKRELEEPLAGKSTLNRLELIGRSERYHKISYSTEALDRLLVNLYIESHAAPPPRSCSIWMPPTSRCTAISRSDSSTATTTATAICRLYIFAGDQLLCARLRPANQDAAAVRSKKSAASSRSCVSAGPK